jgi:hypothetical protein
MVKGIDHQATIAEGDEVAVFYVLDTPVAKAPVAEWYTVGAGKDRAHSDLLRCQALREAITNSKLDPAPRRVTEWRFTPERPVGPR